MSIRNQYRYFISAFPFGTREIMPLKESDAAETFTKSADDFIADYRREISGKLKLVGADFDFLYGIETSVYRCESVTITIQKNCSGGWSDWYTGVINLTKCEFNPGMCEVDFQIDPADAYTCFEEKRQQDVDLFGLVGERHTMGFIFPDSELEYVEYETTAIPIPFPYWAGSGTPQSGGWVLWKHTFTTTFDVGTVHTNNTFWVREKRTVDCAITLPTPWVLISETCPGTGRVYARPAVLYGLVFNQTINSSNVLVDWIRAYKILGRESDGIVSIDNGMKLSQILTNFFLNSCNLNVVSEFFQINPASPSSTNYVTGLPSKVYNLLVFQKSDVKRASAINNATKCIVDFEDLFFGICRFFNLEYWIEGDTVHIEHVSFRTMVTGLDLTLPRYKKFTRFKTRYQYDTSKLPREEKFITQEKTVNSDFEGFPIRYSNNCANSGSDGVKEYPVNGVTTDLVFVLNNPESDSKAVSDEGVFLAATDAFAGGNYLITEPAVLFEVMPNNSLAWSQLLRDYHRHKRPFRNGNMNAVETTFDSVIPTVKGEEIAIPFCCGDVFDPGKLVKYVIGDGAVESTSFSLRTGIMKLNLLYEADDEGATNQPPIANTDAASVAKNLSIDIDVLANDSDAQGIGSIDLVEITTGPTNGTATVVDKKIRYVPASDWTGTDSLYYRIRDNALQYSNTALVVINVIDPAPDAVNDAFTVRRNQSNTIPSPGLLANDSPGSGAVITVVPGTVVSNNGVNVTVNADGSFTYPAPDVTGTDSFSYQIINDQGGTDTATVTLTLITVPDSETYVMSFSAVDAFQACFLYTQPITRRNYYSTASPLSDGAVLYEDDLLTEFAAVGWYSNGLDVFRVAANGIIVDVSNC
jgi:hypothetical protein